MKKWYRLPLPNHIIYLSQYIPLRCLISIFQSFPPRTATQLGNLLGRLIHLVNRKHRNIALSNLNNAFPEKLSPNQASGIVRRIYEHFGMAFAHLTHMSRLLQKNTWPRFISFKNRELIDRLLKERKGIILVGAHQGNWEVTLYAMGLAGYPVNFVVFRLLNPMVNSLFERSRTYPAHKPWVRGRLKVIYTQKAIETSMEILKRGEIVVFLVDLTGRKRGVPAQFFNQTAPTLGGPANLALKTLSPVVPFYSYMIDKSFNYEAGFGEPIFPVSTNDKDKDIQKLTQQYTSRIEDIIRQHPEQWIWFHRKWKQYRTEYS